MAFGCECATYISSSPLLEPIPAQLLTGSLRFMGIATSHRFAMDTMLAWSASHLAKLQGDQKSMNQALRYRVLALKGLQDAIGKFSSSNADAILAASVILSWQAPDSNSWAVLKRGTLTVIERILANNYSSVLVHPKKDKERLKFYTSTMRYPRCITHDPLASKSAKKVSHRRRLPIQLHHIRPPHCLLLDGLASLQQLNDWFVAQNEAELANSVKEVIHFMEAYIKFHNHSDKKSNNIQHPDVSAASQPQTIGEHQQSGQYPLYDDYNIGDTNSSAYSDTVDEFTHHIHCLQSILFQIPTRYISRILQNPFIMVLMTHIHAISLLVQAPCVIPRPWDSAPLSPETPSYLPKSESSSTGRKGPSVYTDYGENFLRSQRHSFQHRACNLGPISASLEEFNLRLKDCKKKTNDNGTGPGRSGKADENEEEKEKLRMVIRGLEWPSRCKKWFEGVLERFVAWDQDTGDACGEASGETDWNNREHGEGVPATFGDEKPYAKKQQEERGQEHEYRLSSSFPHQNLQESKQTHEDQPEINRKRKRSKTAIPATCHINPSPAPYLRISSSPSIHGDHTDNSNLTGNHRSDADSYTSSRYPQSKATVIPIHPCNAKATASFGCAYISTAHTQPANSSPFPASLTHEKLFLSEDSDDGPGINMVVNPETCSEVNHHLLHSQYIPFHNTKHHLEPENEVAREVNSRQDDFNDVNTGGTNEEEQGEQEEMSILNVAENFPMGLWQNSLEIVIWCLKEKW